MISIIQSTTGKGKTEVGEDHGVLGLEAGDGCRQVFSCREAEHFPGDTVTLTLA